ncbi:MAG: DnaA ATPase domain-containing protein [Nitrospinota bacterium]
MDENIKKFFQHKKNILTENNPYQLNFDFKIDRNDRFETFLVNTENAASIAICKDFAADNSATGSLTIHGPSAAGKTHLLLAILRMSDELSNNSSAYLHSSQFIELVMSKSDDLLALKTALQSYKDLYMFGIDNIELLFGNYQAEEELFHIYNSIMERSGKFVCTVDSPPTKWNLEDFLQSRLLWGKTVGLYPVSADSIFATLKKMATDIGVTLADSVALWMVNHLPRDIATLKAILAMVNDYSLAMKRKITIPLIKEMLANINKSTHK